MNSRKKLKANAERQTGVLLEDLDSKLDRLVEGQQGLDRKIDKNHEEFREFASEVSFKFDAVFDELRIIRNELKEKVSREEFALLEKRVIKLERSRN